MIDQETTVKTMGRMKEIRRRMVREYPFFGELLMNLHLAVAEVETACTDGKYLIVDPTFSSRLSDEELLFIYMHEVMHVVFFHCFRTNGRNHLLWNIACDYSVNSNIIMAMGVEDYSVDGVPVMHQIDGKEACYYTADEIYKMLLKNRIGEDPQKLVDASFPDSHEIWEEIDGEDLSGEMDRWNQIALDATRRWYGRTPGIAAESLRRYRDHQYKAQLKWKQIIRDFIRYRSVEEDYGFRPPDRRFQEEEFIYPGLNEADAEVADNIWFFIDKSGSISRKMLLSIIGEIEYGLKQVKNLSGLVSFFDMDVTEPIPFSDLKEFMRFGIPVPEGGTSFLSIFQYAAENRRRFDPKGMIILTDGQAEFPRQNPMPHIPVLWIIIDGEDIKPTFGRVANISSKWTLSTS